MSRHFFFIQPYTIPDPDSTRDDLQYYEHDADPLDDWIVRTKKEWSGLPRIATHPLDLAVLRLANLERNIERRYLKEPLWNPAEVMRLAPLTPTPGEEHPMDVIRWAEGPSLKMAEIHFYYNVRAHYYFFVAVVPVWRVRSHPG